jgi:flagellar motor switch/type III secretory pathway protein FliN
LTWRSFSWDQLKRIDGAGQHLVSRLSVLGRGEPLSTALSKAFEAQCSYEHARASLHPKGVQVAMDDGFVARFTTVPGNLPFYFWLPASSCLGPLNRLFDDTKPRSGSLDGAEWGSLAYVALEVLKGALDAGLPPVHLEANPPPPSLVSHDLGQGLVFESTVVFRGRGIGRNFGRILIPSATAEELAKYIEPQMFFGDAVGRAQISLPVHLPAGRLPFEALRLLAVGDVVFVADSLESLMKTAQIQTSHHKIAAELTPDDDAFRVDIVEIKECPMENTSPEAATTKLTLTEVDIEIRMGSVRVSLLDLGSLAPGSVFVMDTHPGDPVELVVGGSVIAQAELVVVGQRVGCRVIQRLK